MTDRLLVVRCPGLLEEDEGGALLRTFISVLAAVEVYCPWVEAVRPGICSLPARGPARYFGANRHSSTSSPRLPWPSPTSRWASPMASSVPRWPPGCAGGPGRDHSGVPRPVAGVRPRGPRPGRAAGPARDPHPRGLRRPPRAPCPWSLRRRRRGLPSGSSRRHRELPGLANRGIDRHIERHQHGGKPATSTQGGFWGGASDRDAGRRGPWPTCNASSGPTACSGSACRGSQPGRAVPAGHLGCTRDPRRPDPRRALARPDPAAGPGHRIGTTPPLWAQVVDDAGEPVVVSGRGLLTATPGRLSVAGGPWTAVTAWAGPWPAEERWWSRARRRTARMQVVLAGEDARLLLTLEQGRWWVEATYG